MRNSGRLALQAGQRAAHLNVQRNMEKDLHTLSRSSLFGCRRLSSSMGGRSASLVLMLAVFLLRLVAPSWAQAPGYSEKILYSFTGRLAQASTDNETALYTFTGGFDGGYPAATLISDANGNLYGTTFAGGASDFGVVFKVSPKGKETVLYSFCTQANCADGAHPRAGGLISDAKGNLYGTAYYGGASGYGVVYKVSPERNETVLYSFTGGTDGANPYAGVISDAKGRLYGTTSYGGAFGKGVVFKVSPKGEETVLYNFTGGSDGANPTAGVISDAKGNLYGTTSYGGAFGYGVVYKVSPERNETVLYSFTGGTDGANPYAGVISDAKGNLYGTTPFGGAYDHGVMYKVSPEHKETVLHSFTGGADGDNPYAGLIFDAEGNLYGTTFSFEGVVFKVNPKDKETVLYSFTGGTDGGYPYAGVIFDAKGNLYGTTYYGGIDQGLRGYGVVYKIGK